MMDGPVALPASASPVVPATAVAVRSRLPGRLPAAHAALLVAGERDAFALTGAWAASLARRKPGGAVREAMAAGGAAVARPAVAAIVGVRPLLVLGPDEDPLAAFDRLPALGVGSDTGTRVGGGWFGALGYALGVEPRVQSPRRSLPLPAAPLAYYDHVLVCDHKGSWWFEALSTPERADALRDARTELVERLASAPRPRPPRLTGVRFRPPGAAGHEHAVAACRERIRGGEVFQANLCLHLDMALDGRPADLAVAAARTLAPAYGALLQGEWGALVSASPELFLRRTGKTVHTAPIKGTARPGAEGELAASAKDRAENVMIVDLMRNDLGRICAFGSVTVDALAEPRAGAGVTHLVSDVSGTLEEGVGDAGLLRATFPPGSVTGAPKVQALRVIAELEGSAREVYTGAIGYASPLAGLELSVAIRTFELAGGRAQLGVGGGITAASDPAAELEECRTKAAPLLALGGAAVPAAAPGEDVSALPVALAAGRERPDPARGVLETIAVRGGVPLRLDAHLRRLGAPGYDALRGELECSAEALGEGRLRLHVDRTGATEITTGPLPTPVPGGMPLAPVVLPGGLGAVKWADRRLLDALTASLGATPLLVDADGAVLEVAWATIWVQEGDRLLTPPADGRLLPGTARAALLAEDPRCAVEPVGLGRLRAADAIWLSSALRGLVPARLVG